MTPRTVDAISRARLGPDLRTQQRNDRAFARQMRAKARTKNALCTSTGSRWPLIASIVGFGALCVFCIGVGVALHNTATPLALVMAAVFGYGAVVSIGEAMK